MKIKKALSLILSLTLVLSLIVVPSNAAATAPEVEANLVKIDLSNFSGTVRNKDVTPVTSVNAGDVVALQIVAKNNTKDNWKLSTFVVQIKYDTKYFTSKTVSYTDEEGETTDFLGTVPQVFSENGFPAKWMFITNNNNAGVVYCSGTANVTSKVNTVTFDSGNSRILGYILLEAKADIESSAYEVTFSEPSALVNYLAYLPDGSQDSLLFENVTFPETVAITVNGITPILNTVTLNQNGVTVDGTKGATVNATAASKQSTNLTSMAKWTVAPENSGVSIDNAGKITVAKNAKDGDYTITAAGNGTTVTGSANATLKVERAAEQYTVKVTPATAELTIPVGAEKAETTYSAAVTNQYGETIENPTVAWSLSEEVNGVSIAGGKVTVTADAKDAIGTNRQFTVKAACGEAKGTASLTVKRAASVVTSMNLAPNAGNSVIPADGTNMTVTLSISDVKDQYGAETALSSVDWTASIAGTQFAKNEDGSYTATLSTAEVLKAFDGGREDGVAVTFTAKCGDAEANSRVALTLADAVATKIVLTSSPAGDDIVIPTGDTMNTKTYSAAVKDQYGFPMNGEVTFTMAPESAAGVSFDAATRTVSVSKDAAAEESYTVTATCGAATASHTFTVKDKIMHADALSVTQSGFTYGESGKLNPSATLNGKAVEATYTYTDSSNETIETPSNAGTYTVTARYETATDIYTGTAEFTIAPKALTADMLTLSGEYTYNGNEQTVTYEVEDGALLTPDDYNATGFNATNAGTHTVTVTGQRNYSGTVAKNWAISPAVVSIEDAVASNRGYAEDNKSVEILEVTFTNAANPNVLPGVNDYTATGAMADANAGANKPVTVTVTLTNANFTLEGSTFGTKVNIAKAAHDDIRTEMSAKYGNKATLDLSKTKLPEGYQFGSITFTDNDRIFDGSPDLKNAVLSVKLANESSIVDKTARIEVPVESTNYNKYTITVVVTALDKTAQTLTAEALNKTYGDTFAVSVGGAKTDVTYSVEQGSESLLKYENGKFTAIGVGEAKIVASAAESADYAAASIEISVTVAKRPLSVKAMDKSAYVGEKLPELTYQVIGLVTGDELTVKPVLEVKHAADVDPMKKVGEYEIVFKVAPAASANYELTTAAGKLTVSVRPVYVGPTGSPVEVDRSNNGTVTVSPANAAKGTTVTITTNPGKGQELKSLEVLDRHGNSLPLTDLGNGKFSFVMPDGKVTVKPVFGAVDAYRNPYADVQANDWFYGAVQYVTENGLMNGTGKGFEPNLATSRAMIWTILARMSGVNTTVTSGEWYAVAQQWVVANGVSDGTMPNNTITREQLAAMLYRYATGKGVVKAPAAADLSIFADASSVSPYANEAMQWAVSAGLINGMDGKLNPQGSATRAQVATMLMRYAELAK